MKTKTNSKPKTTKKAVEKDPEEIIVPKIDEEADPEKIIAALDPLEEVEPEDAEIAAPIVEDEEESYNPLDDYEESDAAAI